MASVFDCPAELEVLEIGRGVVLQEGRDVALLGFGNGVGIALEAAEQLRPQGITPTVVDARFAKPLDTALLDRLASDHGRIVTIEENVLAGGFGSAVLEQRRRRAASRSCASACPTPSCRTATGRGCWPTSASRRRRSPRPSAGRPVGLAQAR